MSDFEIKEYLTDNISKVTIKDVCEIIKQDINRLNALVNIMFQGPAKVQWRAAWVFEHIYLDEPNMIDPYIDKLIEQFPFLPNNGVRRHVSKILFLVDVSDKIDGDFVNTCFEWLKQEEVPVAVKVYCMDILFQVVKKYPDLKAELKLTLETYMPHNSAGFSSRAKKILSAI